MVWRLSFTNPVLGLTKVRWGGGINTLNNVLCGWWMLVVCHLGRCIISKMEHLQSSQCFVFSLYESKCLWDHTNKISCSVGLQIMVFGSLVVCDTPSNLQLVIWSLHIRCVAYLWCNFVVFFQSPLRQGCRHTVRMWEIECHLVSNATQFVAQTTTFFYCKHRSTSMSKLIGCRQRIWVVCSIHHMIRGWLYPITTHFELQRSFKETWCGRSSC